MQFFDILFSKFQVIFISFPIPYFLVTKSGKILKLKVHKCRVENLLIDSCSFKNNTLKISHS